MSTTKSSSDLAAELDGFGELIRQRAIDESREEIGGHIEEMLVGRPGASRKLFGGKSPEACLEEMLESVAGDEQAPQILVDAAARLRADEDCDEFFDGIRVGVLLAARLMQDPGFDY